MLGKFISRARFHSVAKVNPKFPEGTTAGLYKAAVASRPDYDAVRFDSQQINWTLTELDRYSSALAFGLLEAGFTPGDKLVLYCDPTNAAESVVTQMGAIKAGVSVVTFDEKDSAEAFDHALATSKAKGLIFSPSTETGEDQTRKTFLQQMMPELATMYAGQELNVAKYPNLRHIVQTGHSAMRGVNKFRDLAVYANPAMSLRQIPENQSDWVTHIAYKGGKENCTLTSGELVNKITGLWDNTLSKAGDGSVFVACDLESPLGLASVLACSTNFKKVFMPASFNMSQVLQSLPRQDSSMVVCDQDFYSLEVPTAKKTEYQEMCSKVKNVLVAGDASGRSELFPTAKAVAMDKYNF